MTISSIATCPNPALLGVTVAPIEMTPIESTLSSMEISKPSFTTNLANTIMVHKIGLAITFITFLSLGVATGWLLVRRELSLADKISSLDFSSGSTGQFVRAAFLQTIENNYGILQWCTSQLPLQAYQQAYDVLTAPNIQNTWNAPLPANALNTNLEMINSALGQAGFEVVLATADNSVNSH